MGDEKQSILGFQGADIENFRAQRKNYVPSKLREVEMTESRRSLPQILEVVDRVFAEKPANAALLKGGDLKHTAHRKKPRGLVEVWAPIKAERGSEAVPAQELTNRVADKIADLYKTQGREAGDILILLRRRGTLMPLLYRALTDRGVPCSGTDRIMLNEELVVQDMAALMQAALQPKDYLALAQFLRSPLGGVSEEELLFWAQDKNAKPATPALKRAFARLHWAQQHIDILSPYDFMMRLLDTQNALADFIVRFGKNCRAVLDELLNAALQYEATHPPSAKGFWHWLQQGALEIKADAEQRSDEVRIMTMHGAKGLEAPIVFLPDFIAPANNKSAQWEKDDTGALVWRLSKSVLGADKLCPPFLQALAEKTKDAESAEAARLLYVALTRARDGLFIGGYMTRGSKKIPDNSWYQWLQQGLGFSVDEETAETQAELVVYQKGTLPPAKKKEESGKTFSLPAWAHQSVREESPARPLLAVSSLWGGEEERIESRTSNAEATHFLRGRHLHFLLEHLPRLPTAEREAKAQQWLANHLPDYDAPARAALVQEIMALLGAPEAQVFFAPEARTEVPVIGQVERNGTKETLIGRIDVLATEGERVLVGDYKTDRAPPATAAKVSPRLLVQMAGYQKLLQQQLPEKQVECWLIWSKTAKPMRLPDELLTKHWNS